MGQKKQPVNLLKLAEEIINSHDYLICSCCNKRCRGEYCLPVEMFVQLCADKDKDSRQQMIENITYLFEDFDEEP